MRKFILLLCVCLMGCSTVTVDINDHYKKPDCAISVIDERPDEKMVSGPFITSLDITPSIKDFLSFKICNSSKIRNFIKENNLFVRIKDLKYTSTDYTIFVISGSTQIGSNIYDIQSMGKGYFPGLPSNRLKALIMKSSDDFVNKIEEKLK